MKNTYKTTNQLEVYRLLDKAIATTDERTFYSQLRHLVETRKEKGYQFNDHKSAVLPPKKAWKKIIKSIKGEK